MYTIVKNKMFEEKYNAKDMVNTFQCYYCYFRSEAILFSIRYDSMKYNWKKNRIFHFIIELNLIFKLYFFILIMKVFNKHNSIMP